MRVQRRRFWAQVSMAARAYPGRWLWVGRLNGGTASAIESGDFSAFRPSGAFEATTRGPAEARAVDVFVRFVGDAPEGIAREPLPDGVELRDPPPLGKPHATRRWWAGVATLARAHPDRWLSVGRHSRTTGAQIMSGSMVAFRPAGSFDTAIRGPGEGRNSIYVRYIGEPANRADEPPVPDGVTFADPPEAEQDAESRFWAAVGDQLRAHPGRWLFVGRRTTSCASQIKAGVYRSLLPAQLFDAVTRNGTTGPKRADIYVRFMGRASGEAVGPLPEGAEWADPPPPGGATAR